MLRVTMLKLKRAWSLALTLRYRGDARFPGRFHRLLVVRTATTNTEKDNQWKCKQIIDYLFSSLRTHDDIRRIQSIIMSDIRRLQRAINKQKQEQNVQEAIKHTISPETQYERCNKIIATLFGEEKPLDPEKVEKADPKTPELEVESVLSITDKQAKEELAPKAEIINKTPLVEAEKPKIEGFSTPPRVLGNVNRRSRSQIEIDEETVNIAETVQRKLNKMVRRLENSEILSKVTPITYGVANFSGGGGSKKGGKSDGNSEKDKQDKYDSIAKRHLKTPGKDLNNRLMKEMQQLGIPNVSNISTTNIQMRASKKRRKSRKTELVELEARKFENEPFPTSDTDKMASAIENRVKTSLATPKPSFVSRLHEEGIRYSEQITPTSEEKEGKNRERKLGRRSKFHSRKPKPVPASQPVKLPSQLSFWTTNHPYFQDLSIGKELHHQDVCMIDKRPPYDPNKCIIDPYDKRNIAFDTETYGYEPLTYHTANVTGQNKTGQKCHTLGSKEPADQPVITSQTPKSDPQHQGTHLSESTCPQLSKKLMSIGENTGDQLTDIKSKFDPSKNFPSINANPDTVEELRDALMAAADNKEQSSNQKVLDSESLDFFHQDDTLMNKNPYFEQQQDHQASNQNIPEDENYQHPADSSYTGSHHPRIDQYQFSSSARARQLQQLQAALNTTGPHSGQLKNFYPGYPGLLNPFNPWNQFPYPNKSPVNQNESEKINEPDSVNPAGLTPDERPLYDPHKLLPEPGSSGKKSNQQSVPTEIPIQQWNDHTPESKEEQGFNPNFQTFQPPPNFVKRNPYYYHQSSTLPPGQYPYIQSFWGNTYNPEGPMSEPYKQQLHSRHQQVSQEINQNAGISPDQKASSQATELIPISSKDQKLQPPAGASATFISLPKVNWKASTTFKPSPKKETLPGEEVHVDSQETIRPQREEEIPLPKDEDIPLSELLERVRQRNRQEFISKWAKVDPCKGKCGGEKKPCPPPAPQCPKPDPSPPASPPRFICPTPCKPHSTCPKSKPGCPPPPPSCPPPKCPRCKFVAISLEDTVYPATCKAKQSAEWATDAVVINDLPNQPRPLENWLTSFGSDFETYFRKLVSLVLVRGFEPWVPVPSWPLPVEKKKKRYICPKEGCKERPPPKHSDPCERPCYPGNPCRSFPNKYRKY